MTNYYIGVDVGTGSVRAGLLTEAGHIIATSVQPITIKNPLPGHYEQSAMEIWEAVEATVNGVLGKGQASADQVKGIGFDATCSLVVEGEAPDNRLSVGGSNGFDVIMWMDHRYLSIISYLNNQLIHMSYIPIFNITFLLQTLFDLGQERKQILSIQQTTVHLTMLVEKSP